jgi:diguanylate cyclase (GGDEF)-like protein
MRKPNNAARGRTAEVRRVFSDRELMLYSAAVILIMKMLGVVAAGFVAPELSPPHIWFYRIVFSMIATFAIWSNFTWMRRLDDVRVYQVSAAWLVVAVAMDSSLMIGNPLSAGAMFISFLALAVWVPNFFGLRAGVAQLALITLGLALPLLLYFNAVQQQHMLSRAAAFIPILWAVAFVVYALRLDRRKALEKIERFALTDALTGVANLRALEERAAAALSSRNARITGETGLLLIDLDNFKTANSLHGHAGGDHVLRSIAAGLKLATSSSHLVARIGGDEFAVLVENADPRHMGDLAIRYRNAVISASRQLALPGVSVDASIGTAITSSGDETLEDLLSEADRGMYKVKNERSTNSKSDPKQEAAPPSPMSVNDAPAAAKWLKAETATPDDHSGFSLRWSKRPLNARVASLTWAFGVTVGLLSLAMPDADRSNLRLVVVSLICGYAIAALTYALAPKIGTLQHLVGDVFTLGCIAWIAYLTGGAESPMWPLVFLFIIYEAWFLDVRETWFRLIGPVVVILLPLTYESPQEIGHATGSALYSGVLVAVGVTIAMSYNQYLRGLTRAKSTMLARTDARTGLSNRREFERRVQAEIDAFGANEANPLAIVMIDLDNFKNVNTQHGHKAGDELLKSIALALSDSTRDGECLARVGGDEFAVAISATDAAAAEAIAGRFIAAVADQTARSSLPACRAVSASAGIALYGVHGDTLDELASAADNALMSVKSSGKGVQQLSKLPLAS